MTSDERVAVRARIFGRVQGVWYRGWTEQTAKELGLFGWVRNREDGTVEALFVGSENAVAKMLERCKAGPQHAKVERIETEPAKGITPNRFDVKPTV